MCLIIIIIIIITIRQLSSSSYNHDNPQITLQTSVKESLKIHFKVGVRNLHVTR